MRKAFRQIEEQALLKRIASRLGSIETQLGSHASDEQILRELTELKSGLEAWDKAEWERKHAEILTEVAISLASAISLEEILPSIVDGLARVVPYDAAGVFLVEGDSIAAEYLRGYRREAYEKVHKKLGEGIVGRVVHTGRTAIVDDVTKDPNYIPARNGTRSELAVPMFSPATGEVLGVFNIESNNVYAYSVEDAELVGTMASNAAIAIERARMSRRLIHQQRINEELALAKRIQISLLPANKNLGKLDIHGLSIPCEQVGGDYYDFFPLTKSDVAITIADVSGKGIPAALVMAGLRGSLRVEARTEYAISTILQHVNSFLHSTSTQGEYVTCFYGVLNLERKTLTYSNAGHNPAMLFRQNGEVVSLHTGGVMLGAFDEGEWEEAHVNFSPGDFLLLYTDGVTETDIVDGGMFGSRRLVELGLQLRGRQAGEIVETIRDKAVELRAEDRFGDDFTLLAIVFPEDGGVSRAV